MDRYPPIYHLATAFFRYLVYPFKGGVHSIGADRVPSEGGMLLAPIHTSQLDPTALAVALPKRRLRAMAKEELWRNWLFGKIVEGIGAFPVKRGAGDTESVRKCISILQGGEAVIVFPEGTRNDGGTMLPLQAGVALLAKKSGVPVVPAGIAGTGIRSSKRGVTVVFGEPFRYEDVAKGSNEKECRQAFLCALEERIHAMCLEAGGTLRIAPETPYREGCPDPESGT